MCSYTTDKHNIATHKGFNRKGSFKTYRKSWSPLHAIEVVHSEFTTLKFSFDENLLISTPKTFCSTILAAKF